MSSLVVFIGAMVGAIAGWVASSESTSDKARWRAAILVAALIGAGGAFWTSVLEGQRNKAQLQYEHELRSKSEEIAELNKKIVGEVTGGDSYCALAFLGDRKEGNFDLEVIHNGKYPVYELEIEILDYEKFELARASEGNFFKGIDDMRSKEATHIWVGTVHPYSRRVLRSWQLPTDREKITYEITISARNGLNIAKLPYGATSALAYADLATPRE